MNQIRTNGIRHLQNENNMKCPSCKSNLKEGTTALTFQMSDDRIVVVRDVPALICEECGDESIDMNIAKIVEEQVHKALSDGIRMGFIDFNNAA